MDAKLVEIVGQIAGIGGLALGVLCSFFVTSFERIFFRSFLLRKPIVFCG
jgi:membrane protease YdiL (CAAX protease family)